MKPIVNNGKRSLHVENYEGERTANAIVDYATGMMPHKVERLTSDKLDKFLVKNAKKAVAILFTKKGTIAATYKALSTNFTRGVAFAQIRDNQAAALSRFDITADLPHFVVLTEATEKVNHYDGEIQFEGLRAFVESHVPPYEEGEEDVEGEESSKTATKEEAPKETNALQFSRIETVFGIENECFDQDSRPCLLAPSPLFTETSFSTKHKLLSFVEYDGPAAKALEDRELPTTEVLYVNGKKNWYIAAGPDVRSKTDIVAFIDRVKQGEAGSKKKFTTVIRDEL